MQETRIQTEIAAYICSELLNDPNFALDHRASLVGDGYIDSFGLTQLGTFLEEKYNIVVDTADLAELADNGRDTVADIAAYVASQLA